MPKIESTPWYAKYKVDVPEGQRNGWKISRFSLSQEAADRANMRAMFSNSHAFLHAGDYTKLTHRGFIVMSDTVDEIRDHLAPIRKAQGVCLVNGLGLGVVVNGMLLKPEVERVDVVEKSPDVIALVAPHWEKRYGKRFRIYEGDAYTWTPPRGLRYAVVWHDIWSDIASDNLPEMAKLHRRYGRRCDWQGSWKKERCRCLQRQEQRQERRFG